MKYYSYEEFSTDIKILCEQVKKDFDPDVILAIARGGMSLGHFLAQALDLRDLYSLNSIHYEQTHKLDTINVFNIPNLQGKKRVLLVDDIIDSGETMIEIKRILHAKHPEINFQVATIFYKDSALLRPDFSLHHADDWIEFFWDITMTK